MCWVTGQCILLWHKLILSLSVQENANVFPWHKFETLHMHKQCKVLGVAIMKNSQPAAIPRPGADRGTTLSAAFLFYFICSQTQTGMAGHTFYLSQLAAGLIGAPLLLQK